MGLKHLAVGSAICSVLLGVGAALTLTGDPGKGIAWLSGGVVLGVLSVLAYWRSPAVTRNR